MAFSLIEQEHTMTETISSLIPVTRAEVPPRVLVVDKNRMPIGFPNCTLSWKSTVTALCNGHVIPLTNPEHCRYVVRSTHTELPLPEVVQLTTDYPLTSMAQREAPFNWGTLMLRDLGQCMFTGEMLYRNHKNPHLRASMDHYRVPYSQGGRLEWGNVVLASAWVNSLKQAVTPLMFTRQTGFRVRIEPWVPSQLDLLLLSLSSPNSAQVFQPTWGVHLQEAVNSLWQAVPDQVKRVLDAAERDLPTTPPVLA
jgi:hypothetical protein